MEVATGSAADGVATPDGRMLETTRGEPMKKDNYQAFKDRLENLQEQMEVITPQLERIRTHRMVYDQTVELVQADEEIDQPSIFWEMFLDAHMDEVLMFLRRMIDKRSDVISMMKVLQGLKTMSDKGLLTLDNWETLFPPEDENIQHQRRGGWVRTYTDGEVTDRVCGEMIERDLKELEESSKDIKVYIDTRKAHWSKKAEDVPTAPFGSDLKELLDRITGLHQKYSFLILFRTVSPDVVHAYNWKIIFQKAWKPPWKLPEQD